MAGCVNSYDLHTSATAEKELSALPDAVLQRVDDKIKSLADNPRPQGCAKMAGYRDLWRVRIGDWRVLYRIDDKEKRVNVLRITHRREVYQP